MEYPYKTKQAQVGDVLKLEKDLYVVERTAMEGGGTGHGPHDIYPDGWHVTARMLDPRGKVSEKNKKVQFFQSGCFTGMREEVEVVGRMERIVTVKYKWLVKPTRKR